MSPLVLVLLGAPAVWWLAQGRTIGGAREAILGCAAGAALALLLTLALFGAPHHRTPTRAYPASVVEGTR